MTAYGDADWWREAAAQRDKEIMELQAKIRELETANERAAGFQALVQDLGAQVAERDARIKAFDEMTDEHKRDRQVIFLHRKLDACRARLEQAIRDDSAVYDLRQDLAKARASFRRRRERVAHLEARARSMRAGLNAIRSCIEQHERNMVLNFSRLKADLIEHIDAALAGTHEAG